ncbi:ABC transporter permease subunit [Alkalibacter rhizosphaerae]|uniref:ABC transporter permease subunit n=1 Tax=Alkalibacter rhizosphaerae TaxID=2815577 RepID=A0A974XGF2_9FIRM|nr:ABC transporter permease subunit [Alkalibacter rhizosphaerae]QSX09392.1 ABC transporter permease subunit [Alkalibacter rhizosphaerae]
MKNKKPLVKKWMWGLLLLVAWEIFARFGGASPLAFPSLVDIGKALAESIISGDIVQQTAFSLGMILWGLFLALVLALALSTLSIINGSMDALSDTLVSIFHPLPGIALLPLVILWFGTGSKAVIIIIVHSVVWPLLLNLKSGFKSVPLIYQKIGKNYEYSLGKRMRRIYIPASLPFGLSGLKIGWARAWRAAISAEMIFGATGGKGGIGWYIFNKRVFMDTPGLFAGLVVIILIGMLVEDVFFSQVENRTVKKWGMSQ